MDSCSRSRRSEKNVHVRDVQTASSTAVRPDAVRPDAMRPSSRHGPREAPVELAAEAPIND